MPSWSLEKTNKREGRAWSVHVTCDARILIRVPRSSQCGLAIKDAELVKPKNLPQPAAHCNARFAGANDQDRIVCIGRFLRPADMADLVDSRRHGRCINQVGRQRIS